MERRMHSERVECGSTSVRGDEWDTALSCSSNNTPTAATSSSNCIHTAVTVVCSWHDNAALRHTRIIGLPMSAASVSKLQSKFNIDGSLAKLANQNGNLRRTMQPIWNGPKQDTWVTDTVTAFSNNNTTRVKNRIPYSCPQLRQMLINF